MTCTNFPNDNIVENVTQHQVGSVTYLYKGGAPTAPLWEAITPPINLEALIAAQGVIIKSPNGTRYQIKVSGAGLISAVAV